MPFPTEACLRRFGISIAMLTLSASGIVSAAPYKWVDKSGQVHYSQVPPVGAPAVEVNVAVSHPAPPPVPPSSEQEDEPEEEQGPALDKLEQAQLERMARIRKENCLTSKNNLMILENNSHVREKVDGEYRVISQEEREKRIARLRKQLKELCQ